MGWVVNYIRGSEMLRLQTADPKSDLQFSIRKNDMRFIGLGGITPELPGDSLAFELALIKGSRYIEGTGDDSRHPFYGYLIDRVRRYAKTYNTLLARHILQSETSDPRIRHLRGQQK
jgi:hypothetical protein